MNQDVSIMPIESIKRYERMQENSPKNIENRFQFAKEFLKRNFIGLIFIDETCYRNPKNPGTDKLTEPPNPYQQWDTVNFAFALMGNGKIVHWKIKNRQFKVE
jgi:hypothetical protein